MVTPETAADVYTLRADVCNFVLSGVRAPRYVRGALFAALFAAAALPALAQNTWVVADFNGDSTPDLVTLGPSTHAIPGIRSRLFEDGALAQSDRFRNQTLRVRDVDGDSDRDIVLESASSVALEVWLNDGSGHFEEGRLKDFNLDHTGTESCLQTKIDYQDSWFLTDESPQDAELQPALSRAVRLTSLLYLAVHADSPRSHHLRGIHPRGPPQF